MSVPITTLSDIILLAHQQYGIRFQLTTQQLVDFANHIQFIAYNQDMEAFEENSQILFLGQDMLLETDVTYTAPAVTDYGLNVSGSTSGVLGKLMYSITRNRVNQWIIEPPDGGTNWTAVAGETLTIVGGSAATGVVAQGQSYPVSSGPYPFPKAATAGVPPFRKFISVNAVTDAQKYGVPSSSSGTQDDYGFPLNGAPGSRSQNYPFKLDKENQTIELVSSSPPEILQTEKAIGPGGTTLNTSRLRWSYYKNPPPIQSIDDEANLVIPEEYRYEIIYKGVTKLADTATYGDRESIREMIVPLCARFWEDMQTQFQGIGRGNDWISEPDGNGGQPYLQQSVSSRRIIT